MGLNVIYSTLDHFKSQNKILEKYLKMTIFIILENMFKDSFEDFS